MSESGFEVARAYVAVSPDAGGFADELADQLGGIGVSVQVTPDMGDFTGAVDEAIGGLAASVIVTPDMDGFSSAVDEGIAGLGAVEVPISVVPDLSGLKDELAAELDSLSENLTEGFSGGIPVAVLPDTADFAEALDAAVEGLSVTVAVLPDMSGFEDALGGGDFTVSASVLPDMSGVQDQISAQPEPTVTVTAEADTAPAVASLDQLATAAEEDAAGVGQLQASLTSAGTEGAAAFSAVGEAAESANDGVEVLYNGILSIGPAATEAEAAVANAMTRVGTIGQSVDYSAVTAGLNSAGEAAQGLAGGVTAASGAGTEASGIFADLATRLSYFAVDPFMWMYGLPRVIDGVSDAVSALDSNLDSLTSELAAADNATGFNVTGYRELAEQASELSESFTTVIRTASGTEVPIGRVAAGIQALGSQATETSQQATAAFQDISSNLGILEGTYGISAQQALQLAKAAGVTGSELAGSGSAANAAMAKIEAYANANIGAQGPVNELADDVSTFGNDALTASTRVSALDDAYQLLVGNFVSAQQDMLAVSQDFLSLEADASIAGASMTGVNTQSVSLQQSFYATAGAIEQTAQAMTDAKDPAAEITAYIQEQAGKLADLTGGNQQAQQAVAGLYEWESRLTGGLDQADQMISQASADLQSQFITQLGAAGAKSKTVSSDVNELADSILATGTQSNETEAERAQLIHDLEQAGLSAQQATTLVDAFIKKIQQIPSHVSLTLTETATGTWSVTGSASQGTAEATGPGGARLVQSAGGGLITTGSHVPRADDVPALLSHGEYVVQAAAVAKYGPGMLDAINAGHYAGGGYAGSPLGLPPWIAGQAAGLETMIEQILEAAVAAAQQSGSGKAPVTVIFNGTQAPGPEMMHAITTQLSAAIGVS